MGTLTKKEQRLLEREARLQKELEQVKARLDARKAQRAAAERKQARADDTRRKVLLGALMMQVDHITGQERWREHLHDLDVFLTREKDRELFRLDKLIIDNNAAAGGDDGRAVRPPAPPPSKPLHD